MRYHAQCLECSAVGPVASSVATAYLAAADRGWLVDGYSVYCADCCTAWARARERELQTESEHR